MKVCLNGRLVEEADAVVSVFDRAFLYGDGLFETVRIANNRPFHWDRHVSRFCQGAEYLGLALPWSRVELARFASEVLGANRMAESVLRWTLSRGIGPRGYSPRGAGQPTLAMSQHPLPAQTPGDSSKRDLIIASIRVPAGDALAWVKSCNKLPQILARKEAEDVGADDALLLNTDGEVTEATGGNVFWFEGDHLSTPPVICGALPGVTRGIVLELASFLRISCREKPLRPEALVQCSGAFQTFTSAGIVEITHLDGVALGRSPVVSKLRNAYDSALREASRSANW